MIPNGIYKLLELGYWREFQRSEMRLKSETTALRIWKGVAFGNDKAECMTTGISGSSGEKYYLQRGGLGNGRPNGRIICVDFESTIITTRIVLEVQ